MAPADSISIFAEGTFDEQVCPHARTAALHPAETHHDQILELVNYLARALPEDTRAAYIQPFQESLASAEGQKPIEEDEERRRKVFGSVIAEVTGLGDGSDKGASSDYLYS